MLAGVRHGGRAGGRLSGRSRALRRHRPAWLDWTGAPVDIRFSIALDGLSLWLFALTSLLMVVAVLVGWEAIDQQASLYYRLLLILETGMLGVFVARDIILFYVFFEFTLIPLFFLIGIWGSQQRRYAAMKFFLFTLAGSLLTFLGLLAIVLWNYYHPGGDAATGKMTFSIPRLTEALRSRPIDPTVQVWIFLALLAGFAIKVPLFPLHTWLPLAHVEAPTAGSVILAGVLLKVGTYGFARFNLPMLPDATATLMPWLLWMSLAGIIYGALVALAQHDIKRLIAYSSVSHLGFCMLGLFALNRLGVQGSVLQMINHGLSTGGLFAVVGMLYERYHTRQIADFGGLARRLPVLGLLHARADAVQHRRAGPERIRRRVPDPAGHVPAGLGRRPPPTIGSSFARLPCWPSAASFWGPGTCCGCISGCFSARSASRSTIRPRRPARSLPARGLLPGAARGVHPLDRLAAAVLPRPHGADAGRPDGPGDAGGRRNSGGDGDSAAVEIRPDLRDVSRTSPGPQPRGVFSLNPGHCPCPLSSDPSSP